MNKTVCRVCSSRDHSSYNNNTTSIALSAEHTQPSVLKSTDLKKDSIDLLFIAKCFMTTPFRLSEKMGNAISHE